LDYRLVEIEDLIRGGVLAQVDQVSLSFLNTYGVSVVIPEKVGERVTGFVLRSLNTSHREFRVVGSVPLYGAGSLTGFSFGHWVVITEGTLDRDVLRKYYPWVVATLTAGMTTKQRALVRAMTDRVVLCYDADGPGREATERDCDFLRKSGIMVRRMFYPRGFKDPGDQAERMMAGRGEDDTFRQQLEGL
jgi:hypothetical protein